MSGAQESQLVRFIWKTYAKPVIGLFGWPDDPFFKQRVKDAGADLVFNLSLIQEIINKPFEGCLFPQNGLEWSKSGQTEFTQ